MQSKNFNVKAWKVSTSSPVHKRKANSFYFQIICKWLLLPLEVFCISNLFIVAMRVLHLAYKPLEVFFIRNLLILAMRMLHLAYKKTLCGCNLSIFNYNCILAYEISFSDTRKLCSTYRSNQPLWKITALHKLILIVLQLMNQIK